MAFKMKGFSYPDKSPLRKDPPTDPKPLFDPFTRTKRQVPGADKFAKKQKRKKRRKNIISDVKKGFRNYKEVLQGKRRPAGWCPKSGPCGGGPGVKRAGIISRVFQFGRLRDINPGGGI